MERSIDLIVHFGLGDAIICNGMIRNYCKMYDTVNLFVAHNNEKSVKYMFKDLKNLNYMVWKDLEVKFYGNITKENSPFYAWYQGNIEKGLNGLLDQPFHPWPKAYDLGKVTLVSNFKGSMPSDMSFYDCARMDFQKKWTDFYMERDLEEEKRVYYEVLGLKDDEEFIFVHDDVTRGYAINENKIENKLKIVRPDNKDILIFYYLYTIEKAKEVHCMNSSFICLIDTIQLKTNKNFYHRYVRGNTGCDPTTKLEWKIID